MGVTALLAVGIARAESTTAFFRVVGPATGDFTRIESGGALVWTHPILGTTCHVQIATSLVGDGNWRDYAHALATGAVTTAKAFDKSTPDGMVFVPSGIFSMGDVPDDHADNTYGELNEAPIHTVQLDAFFMGAREVTQSEWDTVRAWALAHGYTIDCTGSAKGTNHPITTVCWHDAVLWCNAKSEMEGLTPCYYLDEAQTNVYRSGALDLPTNTVKWTASGYRLPVEAEWEYAARGAREGARFVFGGTISHTQANYFSSEEYVYDVSETRGAHPAYSNGADPCTSPGGAFHGNGYGLHDMAGNVCEWCWDRSDGEYTTCTDCGGNGTLDCPDCEGGNTSCPTCGGGGQVACGTCGGTGTIQTDCGDCSGSGTQGCSPCGGDGILEESLSCTECGGSGHNNCSQCGGSGSGPCAICGGSGTETCSVCGGSNPDCSTCGGDGLVACSGCDGTGTGDCISCGGSGQESCGTCDGDGLVDDTCSVCSGAGYFSCGICGGDGTIDISCPACGGGGGENCPNCGGSGSLGCTRCGGVGTEMCSPCDGHGNFWLSTYYSVEASCRNPRGPSVSDSRIVRGGSWAMSADGCRVSRRDEAHPWNADNRRGFRVVRSAAQ